VYTTTASEMAISGTILGKKVVNISNYNNEGSGAYHSISRLLFEAHKHSIKEAQDLLNSLYSCPWSGILIAQQGDIEYRMSEFYKKALDYRSFYKPLGSPRGLQPKMPIKP
jgi:hypothetical protein